MSETSEAREWARGNGEDVSVKGPLPSGLLARWRAAQDGTNPEEPGYHGPDDDGEPPIVITPPPAVPAADEPPAAVPPSPPRRPETPPRGRKTNPARTFLERNKTPAGKRRTRARVSIEDLVQGAWALAGFGLTRVDAMVPVGRVLMWQSGFAGVVAEDNLKNTAVDKILQPLARAGEQGKVAMGLLGPPVLVGLACQNPELMPVLRPFMHMSLAACMEIAGPSMERAQRKTEKLAESLGDFNPDALIDAFFADIQAGPVSAQEEENIRRAAGGNS